jgi:hypothetical protein
MPPVPVPSPSARRTRLRTPGTSSAACCSAGISSSTRRPHSSSPTPSRPRSGPIRPPGGRVGDRVFPPTASRCSDHGRRPRPPGPKRQRGRAGCHLAGHQARAAPGSSALRWPLRDRRSGSGKEWDGDDWHTEPERTLSRFGEVKLGGRGPVGPRRGWTQLRSVLPVRPDRPVISASSMSPRRASAALPSSAAAPVSPAVAAACSAGVVAVVQSGLEEQRSEKYRHALIAVVSIGVRAGQLGGTATWLSSHLVSHA